MVIPITTAIGELDVFNTPHQIGAILIFILTIVLVAVIFRAKHAHAKKPSSREIGRINRELIVMMVILLCIVITMFVSDLIEIIAGVLAIILTIWLVRKHISHI